MAVIVYINYTLSHKLPYFLQSATGSYWHTQFRHFLACLSAHAHGR